MAAIARLATAESDYHRRHLLAASDELLDQVEELRLGEELSVPDGLRHAICAFQARLGRSDAPLAPRTVKAAHDLILAVQQRLMAANPRVPATRSYPGRGGGQAVTTVVGSGGRWKLLALPPLPPSGVDSAWLELVQETVERACDRWAYAQHRAVMAAREKRETRQALASAQAAWNNFWELKQEAEELQRRGIHAL